VEQLSVPSAHLFECFQYSQIFFPLRQTLFLETEVIQSQFRGKEWVLHFSNRFLGQKLLDRERLVELEHCHGGESDRLDEV
jgi:hypothetical protein